MAKASLNFPISSALGNYSVYTMKGVDKVVLRSKGGPSSEQIKTAPEFAFMRRNMSEFGGCGKATRRVMDVCYGIKHLADHNFSGTITQVCRIIMKNDPGITGARSILFSKYGKLLEGFNLNKVHSFDSVVRQSPTVSFARSQSKATIQFPDYCPEVNLITPWKFPIYRFIIVLGIIPDMIHNGKCYAPANPNMTFHPIQERTDWMNTGEQNNRFSHEIMLEDGTLLDDSGGLVVSVGIEFGKVITNSILQPVKFAGCGKILGVG